MAHTIVRHVLMSAQRERYAAMKERCATLSNDARVRYTSLILMFDTFIVDATILYVR